jgi:hypothetical protein
MARYGLVVGVAKYKIPLGSLSKTEGDANAVAKLLKQYGDFEDIQVLTGEVTAKQLEDAVGRLLKERADRNEALIYYTGHAVVVKGNFSKKRGYLALSNTVLKTSNGEITGIENGIALDDLSGLIGEAKLSNLVVLLDCCHSETLLEESQGFLQRAIVTQAFAELKQDYFLVSACRKFEEAYAMKSESYSIFTGAMLRGLAKNRANERGIVYAGTMFDYVFEQLRGTGQEAVSFGYGRALRVVDYRSMSSITPPNETHDQAGNSASQYNFYGSVGQLVTGNLNVQGDNIGTQNNQKSNLQASNSVKQTGLENVTAGGDITVNISQSVNSNSKSSPQLDSVSNLRQKIRQQQIESLRQEIEIVNQQWESTLDEAQRIRLERQLEQKLAKLEEMENG